MLDAKVLTSSGGRPTQRYLSRAPALTQTRATAIAVGSGYRHRTLRGQSAPRSAGAAEPGCLRRRFCVVANRNLRRTRPRDRWLSVFEDTRLGRRIHKPVGQSARLIASEARACRSYGPQPLNQHCPKPSWSRILGTAKLSLRSLGGEQS